MSPRRLELGGSGMDGAWLRTAADRARSAASRAAVPADAGLTPSGIASDEGRAKDATSSSSSLESNIDRAAAVGVDRRGVARRMMLTMRWTAR